MSCKSCRAFVESLLSAGWAGTHCVIMHTACLVLKIELLHHSSESFADEFPGWLMSVRGQAVSGMGVLSFPLGSSNCSAMLQRTNLTRRTAGFAPFTPPLANKQSWSFMALPSKANWRLRTCSVLALTLVFLG